MRTFDPVTREDVLEVMQDRLEDNPDASEEELVWCVIQEFNREEWLTNRRHWVWKLAKTVN
jgi:hypothetical protein